MAIFVAFAWMIEAAEYLGLIETEAQDPESRAYRLAHQGLSLLKSELDCVKPGGARLKVSVPRFLICSMKATRDRPANPQL